MNDPSTTIVFLPAEGAVGPTNNCVGIGDGDRGSSRSVLETLRAT
jgi:hypothetical protein